MAESWEAYLERTERDVISALKDNEKAFKDWQALPAAKRAEWVSKIAAKRWSNEYGGLPPDVVEDDDVKRTITSSKMSEDEKIFHIGRKVIENMSVPELISVGVGHNLLSTGRGLVLAGLKTGNFLLNKAEDWGIVESDESRQMRAKQLQELEQKWRNEEKWAKPLRSSVAAQAGEVLSEIALTFLPASRAAKLERIISRIAAQAAIGGAAGSAQLRPPDESQALAGAVNAIGSGIGEVVMTTGSKAYNILKDRYADKATQALVDTAKKYGIGVGIADLPNTGTLWKAAARLGSRLPFGPRAVRLKQIQRADEALQTYLQQLLPEGYNVVDLMDDTFSKTGKGYGQRIAEIFKRSWETKRAKSAKLFNTVYQKAASLSDDVAQVEPTTTLDTIADILEENPDFLDAISKSATFRNKFRKLSKRLKALLPDEDDTEEEVRKLFVIEQGKGIREVPLETPEASTLLGPEGFRNALEAEPPEGVTIADLFKLDREINSLFRGNIQIKKRDQARILYKIKNALMEDIDDWAAAASDPRATEIVNAWRGAKNHYIKYIRPYVTDDTAMKIVHDLFSPDRIINAYVKRDQPLLAQSFKTLGNNEARKLAAAEALKDVYKSSVRDGVFDPGVFADTLKRRLDGTLKGLLTSAELEELKGLANVFDHIRQAGAVAREGGPVVGGLFSGATLGTGATYLATKTFGSDVGSVAGVLGGMIGASLGLSLALTSNTGRRLFATASRIQPQTEAMNKIMEKLHGVVVQQAGAMINQRLNSDDYLDEITTDISSLYSEVGREYFTQQIKEHAPSTNQRIPVRDNGEFQGVMP